MPLSVHWFLPTAGDSRDVVGVGPTAARREATVDDLTQVARAAEQVGLAPMSVPIQISRPAGGRHPLGRPPAAATPTGPGLADATEPAGPGGLAEPLPAHILADIAAGFAAAVPLWSEVVRHDPDGRRPVLLVATERYEVWVIGWTTGQHVRMHDHGDSAGVFVVTDGELTEVLPDGRGGTVERTLTAGRRRDLAVGIVHDVVNRAGEPATSIHVYSPAVTSMTYYDADTLAPVDTERFAAEVPLLRSPSAAARLLHPAGRQPR